MSLVAKYNRPGPRYTSYPTVPYWDEVPPTEAQWGERARATLAEADEAEGISLYVHLPYCESLCTFCGCTTRITPYHTVEEPYIRTVLAEWSLHRRILGKRLRIREIHLGGGTPTFFSPANLRHLIEGLLAESEVCAEHEFGFEGHPNNTTPAHLRALHDLGFRRVSFGIQDFDPKVQDIVNRIQPFETVRAITESAREVGYESVNFDLIYGLPLQTRESVRGTVEKVGALRPDRIAFYGYAHVPWIKPRQRRFTEADLPVGEEKRALYELGRDRLLALGYGEIGMDHFALDGDPLFVALRENRLHRNFMGFTPWHTRLMVGLGASAISDGWTAFVQNEKRVEEYTAAVAAGRLPVFKGHLLTREDLVLRRHILNLMCRFETSWDAPEAQHPSVEEGIARMGDLVADGLVEVGERCCRVTDAGRPFVRNVAMALDARLARRQPDSPIFSSTV